MNPLNINSYSTFLCPPVYHSTVLISVLAFSTNSFGTDRWATYTRKGNIKASSKCPSTGIKSGIWSIGERASAPATPRHTRVIVGHRGCAITRRYKSISLVNFFTRLLLNFRSMIVLRILPQPVIYGSDLTTFGKCLAYTPFFTRSHSRLLCETPWY
jgi:hypothetical protein